MAQNKHKTKRRIICILCASIISLYALSIPIGAVVNSSQGGFLDFNLTANSTFPLTVGFSYVTRDTSTGAGNTYVYATEIGGFGEEWNTTLYGADTYTQNYTPIEGTEYELQGSLEYNFIERVFPTDSNIVFDDGNYQSVIKRGWQDISIINKAPSGNNILGQQQGVVLRARDVVYNPAWLMTTDFGLSQTDEAMLPTFTSPTVENPSIDAVVLTYSWSCTIIDQEGVAHEHSNYEVFDTRITNTTLAVPIIPIEILEQYKTQKTIIIAEYRGFLDVDYYEYVEPETSDELSGIWHFNASPSVLNKKYQFNYTSVYSNETKQYVELELYTGGILYNGTVGGSIYTNAYSTDSGWYQESLRTINITSKLSEVNDSSALLTWLQANATKQHDHIGGANSVAEEGTWEQVERGGDGYLLKLQYPLYDTSGVTITNTQAYSDFMAYYGFPTLEKYIDTDGTIITPSPPYETDYTGWLGTAVGGFLDFELFPGFTLGGMLGILISFSFIMLFLKFFAGG